MPTNIQEHDDGLMSAMTTIGRVMIGHDGRWRVNSVADVFAALVPPVPLSTDIVCAPKRERVLGAAIIQERATPETQVCPDPSDDG
jgi:hypothetical protein